MAPASQSTAHTYRAGAYFDNGRDDSRRLDSGRIAGNTAAIALNAGLLLNGDQERFHPEASITRGRKPLLQKP